MFKAVRCLFLRTAFLFVFLFSAFFHPVFPAKPYFISSLGNTENNLAFPDGLYYIKHMNDGSYVYV